MRYATKISEFVDVIMLPNLKSHRTEFHPLGRSSTACDSKLYEKLQLKRTKPLIEAKELILCHQFGLRENHSTIYQVHIIADIIERSPEERKFCSTVFLDVAQAFDKV